MLSRDVPPCSIHAYAARGGVDVPGKLSGEPPDLAGLDVRGVNGIEIAEIRIDEDGRVTDVCLKRGVREAVDERAVAAVKTWRFTPARLKAQAGTMPAGSVVPVIFTTTVVIGRVR
jgi:TonB family protein